MKVARIRDCGISAYYGLTHIFKWLPKMLKNSELIISAKTCI